MTLKELIKLKDLLNKFLEEEKEGQGTDNLDLEIYNIQELMNAINEKQSSKLPL